MRFLVAIFILIHGLAHFIGFAKAFGYGDPNAIQQNISKGMGSVWMITAFIFSTSAVLLMMKKDSWWWLAVIAVVISQILIMTIWSYAKYGTLANIIIIVILVLARMKWQLY